MLVRDLLLHTARLLNLKNVEAELLIITEEQSEELGKLLRCLNMTVSEVVEEYLPQKNSQEIIVTNGQLRYADFEKSPTKILSVKDKDGYVLRYSPKHGGLVVKAKSAVVTYSYSLAQLKVEDSVDIDLISMRTLAYGIISEYYILSNRYEEGMMYSKRFKGSLRNIATDFSEKTMPSRRLF